MSRASRGLLIPSSALLWGLQLAFLSPALALILTNLYGASTADVGWVLALYNTSGFAAALVLPALADRRHAYLQVMIVCAALTLALAGALAAATTLPLATLALIVLGGPAGVGSSLLFAHLRHAGAKTRDIVNTRAIVSAAWVAGPPLATVIIGVFGDRAILAAIALVALCNVATTAAMINRSRRQVADDSRAPDIATPAAISRVVVAVIMTAFVLFQATNATAMTILTIYVTETLRQPVVWAGVALGIAAALEVPALLLIGRLSEGRSTLGLIITGCLAGLAYYVGLAFATGPVKVIALQPLNAWFFAAVAGVGLPLFQDLIPRPGLATGLFMNTRRLGSIVSGPVIAFGSATVYGQRGIFVVSAVLVVVGLAITVLVRRRISPT